MTEHRKTFSRWLGSIDHDLRAVELYTEVRREPVDYDRPAGDRLADRFSAELLRGVGDLRAIRREVDLFTRHGAALLARIDRELEAEPSQPWPEIIDRIGGERADRLREMGDPRANG
ncbi:hypothetical protein [Magnetofaba australis]|uniref:Uncharacterized protein n=1 Tax=Magnetofaba australis IT-1 TaxID=1434232 RepID=A0A1Y2K0X0_9PROT|nr:hypothetical protein [Magnetofaba australis]OSM00403.1 hypothetical protein MAIT1_00915 [Magnetofaba australis IT-1]